MSYSVMTNFSEIYPILFKSQSGFSDLDALCKEYESLRDNAPSRTARGKKYFVGHDGIPSSSGFTNRREEHIAIALVNLQHHWNNPTGSNFRFLDYQFPLKSQQADKGVGKIDIIGVNDDGRLILTELKVESNRGSGSNSPLSALMQGLRYAAIVETNLEAISHEAKDCFGVEVNKLTPIIQLLATKKWWEQQGFTFTSPNNQQKEFLSLCDRIKRKIGIEVECLAFDELNVSFGLDGNKPQLTPTPTLQHLPLAT